MKSTDRKKKRERRKCSTQAGGIKEQLKLGSDWLKEQQAERRDKTKPTGIKATGGRKGKKRKADER